MIRKLDLFVYSILISILIITVRNFEWYVPSLGVIATFLINGIWVMYRCICNTDNISIKRTVYIFSLFFLVLAPLSQYLSGVVLWKGNGVIETYSDSDYLYANILILLFFVFFELGYKKSKKSWIKNDDKYEVRGNRALFILTGICTVCTVVIFATNGLAAIHSYSAINAQICNMIFFAPVECLLICIEAVKKTKTNRGYLFICAVEVAASYLVFSINMGRFMFLGVLVAVYVTITYSLKYKSIYFGIFVVGFTLLFTEIRRKGLLGFSFSKPNFNHVDYDAYQIFLLVIKYVSKKGISWGMNLLSAICCFLPRAYFTWRLKPTGGIVVSYYGSWFDNVSCPLPAELYFAFGIVGIILGSYVIGIFVKKTDLLMENKSEFAHGVFCIIVGMTIYIMRGSLLSTFSYTVDILLAYYLIFKIAFIKSRQISHSASK